MFDHSASLGNTNDLPSGKLNDFPFVFPLVWTTLPRQTPVHFGNLDFQPRFFLQLSFSPRAMRFRSEARGFSFLLFSSSSFVFFLEHARPPLLFQCGGSPMGGASFSADPFFSSRIFHEVLQRFSSLHLSSSSKIPFRDPGPAVTVVLNGQNPIAHPRCAVPSAIRV